MTLLAAVCACLLAGGARAGSDTLALVQRAVSAYSPGAVELVDSSGMQDGTDVGGAEGAAGIIFKVPEELVDLAGELSQEKRRIFNFQGSMDFKHWKRKKTRFNIIDWIKEHFRDGDLLRVTDRPENWKPLGAYDVSMSRESGVSSTPMGGKPKMDREYYQGMASSWFTLCPRGDRPWSNRIWEAAMTRSICVIESLEADIQDTELCWIPYKYILRNSSRLPSATSALTDDTVEWLKGIADYNHQMFIKYQTFKDGDNRPTPARAPPKGENCNSIVVA